jgi:hypothetical protein
MSPVSQAIRKVRLVSYADADSDGGGTSGADALKEAPTHLRRATTNRRAHRRLSAKDLDWLRAARMKYGPDVQLVDVSTGGLAVETPHPLTPESTVVFELAGPSGTVLVPARVLRSESVTLDEIPRYRSACAFKRPLELSRLNSAVNVSTHRSAESSEAWDAAPPGRPVPKSAAAWQKVVVRYRDGRILRGFTADFNTERPQLHLSTDPWSGESLMVPLQQLKALFFVREFAGDPTYVEQKTFAAPSQGRKLEVTFEDGEVLVGTTLSYRPGGHGFFVHPADKKANNIRVFVSAVAVRYVRLLSRA